LSFFFDFFFIFFEKGKKWRILAISVAPSSLYENQISGATEMAEMILKKCLFIRHKRPLKKGLKTPPKKRG